MVTPLNETRRLRTRAKRKLRGTEVLESRLLLATDLISNGAFDQSYVKWTPYEGGGFDPPFDFSMDVPNGKLHVDPKIVGINSFDLMLQQFFIPLANGYDYTIRFNARSKLSPRDLFVKVGSPLESTNFATYGGSTFSLTTTMQTFEHTFTMNDPNDHCGLFEIQFGGDSTDFVIDNIKLLTNAPAGVTDPTSSGYDSPSNTGTALGEYTDVLRFGSALSGQSLRCNPTITEMVAEEAGSLTPDNTLKMEIVQPVEGIFDFDLADEMVAFASANNMPVRGHTLVWHHQQPQWFEDGTFTQQEMIDVLYDHIDAVMGQYANDILTWDVVNEAIDDATLELRESNWQQTIGDNYIDLAFTRARQANPNAKLFYNDYAIAELGFPKAEAAYDLIADMVDRGIPIDGVGFQLHRFEESPPDYTAVKQNMARYAALGLEVQITEVDVRIADPVTPAKLADQADIFAQLTGVCAMASNCEAVTTWGLTDADSWLEGLAPGYGAAHLFDENLVEKPAYDAVIATLENPPVVTEPGINYVEFAEFSAANFGAEIEPLAYDAFGNTLQFIGTDYVHASETSAFIGSETNLPADSQIEYRPVGSATTTVDDSSRFHYLHHYHLTGLSSTTNYEYRVVATDERGNVVQSAWQQFSTATPAGVNYLSGGTITSAHEITSSGYYLLTGDLIADRTAFKITASNVTLDLGGHTVIYNEEDFQLTGEGIGDFSANSSHGVWTRWADNIKLVNGTIIQGSGNNAAQGNSIGYSPVHFRNIRGGEISGLKTIYAGPQVTGINIHDPNRLAGNDVIIHHNTVEDRGNVITDRHNGPQAISASGTAHHNLVLRSRGPALNMRRSDADIPGSAYHNEIYVDSYAANSFGILYYGKEDDMYGGQVYGNRIFGTGHMVIAIGIAQDADDFDVYDNFIHLQSTTPMRQSPGDAYGQLSRATGLRTWGFDPCDGTSGPVCLLSPDGLQFHDNHIAIHARDGGDGRGLWLYNDTMEGSNFLYDNHVRFMLEDTISDPDMDSGALVLAGADERNGQTLVAPNVFTNNTFESNFINIMIGHDYGAASGALFRDNYVEKTGNRSDYKTMRVGYYTRDHNGHEFYNTTFSPGASYDSIEWMSVGDPDNSFAVGKTRTLQVMLNGFPLGNTSVTIDNVQRGTSVTADTDASGQLDLEMLHYLSEESGPSGFDYQITTSLGNATLSLAKADYANSNVIPVGIIPPPPPPPELLFFSGQRNATERELYVSDGTVSGSGIVRNLAGTASSNPEQLTAGDDVVYFVATLFDGQKELHVSDGTAAGTNLVKNFIGSASSDPQELMFNETLGLLFFTALRSDGNRELFVSDRTFEGTYQVKNISGTHDSNPMNLTSIGGEVYFSAEMKNGQRELYKTDGTKAGTVLVSNLSGATSSSPEHLTNVNGSLFFVAAMKDGQRELFTSDGTKAGTTIVRNLQGTTSSSPNYLEAVGSTLYFSATTQTGQKELFKSDGTFAGTGIVTNLAGTDSANPRELTNVDGTLFFTALDAAGKRELYKSDGTAGGTVLVADLSGTVSSNPLDLTAYGSELIFSAKMANGEREVFKSDGTTAGTLQIEDLSGSVSSEARDFIIANGLIYFSAIGSDNQREIYFTDGGVGNAAFLADLAGSDSLEPLELVVIQP